MAAICSNCGSKDIVAIQGQEYCINCGQQVAQKKAPTAPAPLPPKVSVATAQTVAINPVAEPKPKVAPKSDPKPPPIPVVKAEPKSKPEPKPKHHSKHHHTAVHIGSNKAHPLKFTWKLSLGVSIPVGALAGAALWFRFDNDLLIYLLTAAVVFTCTLAVLAQSALMYGLSRAEDGRPAERQRWWWAARSGFLDVLNVDLITLISLAILIVSGFAFWQARDLLPAGYESLQAILLALGNILLVWLFFGVLSARHMAIPAVVIGALDAWSAMKLGWRSYVRVGGHLAAVQGETLLARLIVITIIIAAALVIGRRVPNWDHLAVAIGVGVLITVSLFSLYWLLLQVEVRAWLGQYRHWVERYYPGQKMRLLTGRVQPGTKR